MTTVTLPAWMEDLLSDGREFIKKAADLELFDRQLDLVREANAHEDREAAARDQEARTLSGTGLSLGIDPTLLIVALLGLGAVVLLVRR